MKSENVGLIFKRRFFFVVRPGSNKSVIKDQLNQQTFNFM